MELLQKFTCPRAIFVILFAMLASNWQPPLVAGLDCDICMRIGDKGSQTCVRMPCNSNGDVDEAIWKVPRVSARRFDFNDYLQGQGEFHLFPVTTPIACVKIVGQIIYSKSVHQNPIEYTRAMCNYVNLFYPPRSSSYTLVPEMEESFQSAGIKWETYSVNVCDKDSEDNCRVSKEELNRVGPVIDNKPQKAQGQDRFDPKEILRVSMEEHKHAGGRTITTYRISLSTNVFVGLCILFVAAIVLLAWFIIQRRRSRTPPLPASV